MSSQLRILFIDAYDSFSNNIIALLHTYCGVYVTRIYIDATIQKLEIFLTPFAAIVCGPGPGHPACSQDVGLIKDVWTLSESHMIPVLGICLGFQSLACELGAPVRRLPQPRHGIKTLVTSLSTSIFKGVPEVYAIQYHSLYVDSDRSLHGDQTNNRLWKPSETCPQLQPLAWEFRAQETIEKKFKKNPAAILMAIRHVRKPFYGIQFHPESISSEPTGRKIVLNWWQTAISWLICCRPSKLRDVDIGALGSLALQTPRTKSGSQYVDWRVSKGFHASVYPSTRSDDVTIPGNHVPKRHLRLSSMTISTGSLSIPSIVEALDLTKTEVIVLDSEMRQLSGLGGTSIIGIVSHKTRKLEYSVGAKHARLQEGDSEKLIELDMYDGSIFTFIKAFMSGYTINNHHDRPFCGGLMGYINYEACLETIGLPPTKSSQGPDICFAFIEQSIVIDHDSHRVHIQSLHQDQFNFDLFRWLNETVSVLSSWSKQADHLVGDPQPFLGDIVEQTLPQESEYKSKVTRCQEFIGAGDSYELCLTDQSSITLRGTASSWNMYCRLRRLNPAPFAAYVRLGPLTLLSTSPERFMCWSRAGPASNDSEEKSTKCQFRPIKGTVQKRQVQPDGSVHHTSRTEATSILASQKEQAENLMIVDLIRHDLYELCQSVRVKDLMVVEEYESVFQLVSVIEGWIRQPRSPTTADFSGIACLAASLPPGSMTGAPKKRSCRLLREIENSRPRSVYSGVLGYMCVSGKGDFSVVIRSVYRWDEREESHETWNIGAGGAVTTLSTEDGEWNEMLTKLRSTYRLFFP